MSARMRKRVERRTLYNVLYHHVNGHMPIWHWAYVYFYPYFVQKIASLKKLIDKLNEEGVD